MTAPAPELWVVMPVYNEQEALRGVVQEWLSCLRAQAPDFALCLINDGSTDDSLGIMRQLEQANDEVTSLDKSNTGHGRTCVAGYRMGIGRRPRFVLQIDSDGQCDPRDFSALWRHRGEAAVFGRRIRRRDGVVRSAVSRLLVFVVWICSGVYVPDPNVPYRLMPTAPLSEALDALDIDVDLANLFVALVMQARKQIHWVDIGFRARRGGVSATSLSALAVKCLRLVPQLVHIRSRLRLSVRRR